MQYIVATETSLDLLLHLAKKDARVNAYFGRVRADVCLLLPVMCACMTPGLPPPSPVRYCVAVVRRHVCAVYVVTELVRLDSGVVGHYEGQRLRNHTC